MLKSAIGISVLTFCSRILGALRDILLGIALGTSLSAEAYIVATRIPNLVRQLFSDGIVLGSVVPALKNAEINDGIEFKRRVSVEILLLFMLLLILILAVVQLFLPSFVLFLAPGFSNDEQRLQAAIELSRITSNFLVLSGNTAVLTAILHSYRKFLLGAAMPMILNISLISVLIYGIFNDWNSGWIYSKPLAWAIIIAGLFQVIILFFACRYILALDYPAYLVIKKISKNALTALKRIFPAILGTGITALQTTIGGMVASFTTGAVAILYYAERLIQLPIAIIGLAIASVILPEISQYVSNKKINKASSLLGEAMSLSVIIVLPACLGLIILADPIIKTLFAYQNFTISDAERTAKTLFIISFSVLPAVLSHIGTQSLFALGKQKLVFYISVVILLIFCVTIFVFHDYLDFYSIPLAFVVAGILRVVIILTCLNKFSLFYLTSSALINLAKSLLAASIMGLLTYFTYEASQNFFSFNNGLAYEKVGVLSSIILLSILTYLLVGIALKLFYIDQLKSLVRR